MRACILHYEQEVINVKQIRFDREREDCPQRTSDVLDVVRREEALFYFATGDGHCAEKPPFFILLFVSDD